MKINRFLTFLMLSTVFTLISSCNEIIGNDDGNKTGSGIMGDNICSWMKNIEGEWVSDFWGQIFTFYPNGEYVQLDKKLVDYASSMSLRGKYECTSDGYIRMLLNGEEIFETSIVKVNIEGENMNWTLVDDDDSDGHGNDITIPFVKK